MENSILITGFESKNQKTKTQEAQMKQRDPKRKSNLFSFLLKTKEQKKEHKEMKENRK